jgi:hypothetical protein
MLVVSVAVVVAEARAVEATAARKHPKVEKKSHPTR